MALILVIDDDEMVRSTVRASLEGAGHRVAEAGDGRVGLTQFRAASYDLVIVDLYMPDIEGLQTIREIRQLNPVVPIIAMSGGGSRGETRYLKVALEFGASRALGKPFTRTALMKEVTELLQHKWARERGPARRA